MKFDRLFVARSCALAGAAALIGAVLFFDFGKAIAQYRTIGDVVPTRESGALKEAVAGLRAHGLPPESKLGVSILENGRSLYDGTLTVSKTGTVVVGNIPLTVTGKSGLLVHLALPPATTDKGGEARSVSLTLNPALRQVFFSGSGIQPGTPLSVNIDGTAQDINMATDWAGNFTTLPDSNTRILSGKGSACIDIGPTPASSGASTDTPFSLCFDIEAEFSPALTQAQTPGGPGGAGCPPSAPAESPFSTWAPPDDCAPGGTCLSVCNGEHMRNLFRLERELWVRAFMMMTEQFTTVMMHQAYIVGTFFDAKHQLEIQRWFQQMHAEAHKDYQPSWQMCRFGTFSQGLTSAERKIDMNVRVLTKYMLERQTAPAPSDTRGTGAPGGPTQDRLTRVEHFKSTYCNPMSNNVNGLSEMCPTAGDPDRQGKDIDYTRGLETRLTLDLDFSDDNVTNDETDVIALSKQLFSHKVFKKSAQKHIMNDDTRLASTQFIQDQRSVAAARGVATNSFAHIVGMRGQGTAISATYMRALMRQFAMNDRDIEALLGRNPSYFAQMEVLTKKMFQHPNFYTELYDTPTNVERQGAALQAIKLMQDRDRFDASLRREMLVSLLVEMKLRRQQAALERRMQSQLNLKR